MAGRIEDDFMSAEYDGRLIATARYCEGAVDDGRGVWAVSGLPGRLFTRNQDEMLAFDHSQQRERLATAMYTYLNDWEAEVKKAKQKALKESDENSLPPHAHYESVVIVTKKINDEWKQKLSGSPNELSC